MDIDPLRVLGGCRFLISSNCMAKIKTKTPPSSSSSSSSSSPSSSSSSFSSSSSSRDYSYSKSSHPFLLLVSILFMFLLLARPADQIRSSNMVSEPATTQTLPASTESSSSRTTSTTSSVPPKKAKHGKTLPSKQFEASEHEVPSGPNPISNR